MTSAETTALELIIAQGRRLYLHYQNINADTSRISQDISEYFIKPLERLNRNKESG